MVHNEAQELGDDDEHLSPSQETVDSSQVPAVASGLAGLVIEHTIRQGRRLEVPCFGIELGPEESSAPPSDELAHGE